ncbi:MAG TPA: hypothetical protein PKE45_17820 [Caldilineaceae bacterium]|nr:hypothetical protein [Caldilineaceae bacterium]
MTVPRTTIFNPHRVATAIHKLIGGSLTHLDDRSEVKHYGLCIATITPGQIHIKISPAAERKLIQLATQLRGEIAQLQELPAPPPATPDPRVQELIDFAKAEGLELPYPAHVIALVERVGGTVNLKNGVISPRDADRRTFWPNSDALAWVEEG